MKYFKKIVGNKVYLSPINSDDYLKYVEWLNNYEIAKGVNHVINLVSIDSEKAWLEKATSEKYIFAIVITLLIESLIALFFNFRKYLKTIVKELLYELHNQHQQAIFLLLFP